MSPELIEKQNKIIEAALLILENRAKYGDGTQLSSPTAVKNWLRLKLQNLEHETFYCVWLDAQNRVISFEEMFRGTLTQASVYPREIVKAALRNNAASVLLAHNHPSGFAEPSDSDERLTDELKRALALIGVRVLDHLIIGRGEITSFAERGMI